jgi:hypothetical protein
VKNASRYALATASRSSGPAPTARSKRLACASSWWCCSDSGASAGWRFTVSRGPRRAARAPAGAGPEEPLAAASAYVDAFFTETVGHFRCEEEILFPLYLRHAGSTPVLERIDAAYAATPERFVRGQPTPPTLPTAAWINKATTEEAAH